MEMNVHPAVAVIAICGLTMWLMACEAEGTPGTSTPEVEEDSTPVAGFEVKAIDLSRTVQVAGTVEPVERVRLKAGVEGVLERVEVEEGDEIKKGALVARSDDSEMRAEKRRAQAILEKVKGKLERKKPLVEIEAVRRAEVDDLEAEIGVAEAEVDLWKTRIERSQITAPKDATVAERHVDPGGFVTSGEAIVNLVDLSTLVVPASMSERDVASVDSGDSVELSVDAEPGRSLEGSIRRIYPTADADSRRVPVEIAIDDIPEDVVVKPGFRARTSIDVDRRQDVLAIPDEALLASTPDDPFVYVIDDDELVRQPVTTGAERRNLTEITEGLEEDDVIVGTNPTNLSEEMRVHVSEWVEHR